MGSSSKDLPPTLVIGHFLLIFPTTICVAVQVVRRDPDPDRFPHVGISKHWQGHIQLDPPDVERGWFQVQLGRLFDVLVQGGQRRGYADFGCSTVCPILLGRLQVQQKLQSIWATL